MIFSALEGKIKIFIVCEFPGDVRSDFGDIDEGKGVISNFVTSAFHIGIAQNFNRDKMTTFSGYSENFKGFG